MPPKKKQATITLQASLQQALSANQEAQAALQGELDQLARRKARNRAKAARLWQEIGQSSSRAASSSPSKKAATPARKDPPWPRRVLDAVDPELGRPQPNADAVKRLALLESNMLYHRQPPWTKKENKLLLSLVEQASQKESTSDDAAMDFAPIATEFNELRADRTDALATAEPRTTAECQIQYDNLTQTDPFTPDELKQLREVVPSDPQAPRDWDTIAAAMNKTPWQCFVTYLTKIRIPPMEPWTVAQDELLLAYVAAQGPQFVVDMSDVIHVAQRLFPYKSRDQLIQRINRTLLNPNLKQSPWSTMEERQLALAHKLFMDQPHPTPLASSLLPDRSNISVIDKWNRTLNPDFSSKPLTAAEDARLKEIVPEHLAQLGWQELAVKFFPDRHPQRLRSRWADIATDEDLKREVAAEMKEEAKQSITGTPKPSRRGRKKKQSTG